MIFIENKYTRIYFAIINNSQQQSRIKLKKSHPNYIYYEYHHIVPKCLSGSNDKTNLAVLTAREHFICHWLLTKMTTGTAYIKMIFALFSMRRKQINQPRYNTKITSKVYEKLRIVWAELSSNNQKGKVRKKHSEETKAKMREAHIYRLPDSDETRAKKSAANIGNTHTKGKLLSEEHKAKLRKPKSIETKENMAKAQKLLAQSRPSPLTGRVLSEEAKQKLRKPKRKVP